MRDHSCAPAGFLPAPLERALTGDEDPRPSSSASEVRCETLWVASRDGVRLATDIHLPGNVPAPVVAMRTPYGRSSEKFSSVIDSFLRNGYAVVTQDCRGTGDSEPEIWDYYMFEREDGYDLVEWIARQTWFDGFLGSFGGSYAGQTQWSMATHPRMSTIVPEVSGLGVATNTVHLHMVLNAYARSVGKGAGKTSIPYSQLERLMLPETLSGGYFNQPLSEPLPHSLLERFPQVRELSRSAARHFLWERYCEMTGAGRAELVRLATGADHVSIVDVEALSGIFGQQISHDRHSIPHADSAGLCRLLRAPCLLRTGWYDWALNDALATWSLLQSSATEDVRSRSRLIIAPSAHSVPGYHEGADTHAELRHNHRAENQSDLLLLWYAAVRAGALDDWPCVIYYLMGANEWRTAGEWPPAQGTSVALYLQAGGGLAAKIPETAGVSDSYRYDPQDPTPTVGGSIVSAVYPPGSIDVSTIQRRPDVLTYSTEPLTHDLDVVGPLRVILYASSSARDTDFCARLSDVFPDDCAIQLQSGILRARYRNLHGEPELMEPGRIYRLELDLWATANRFKSGHRLRLDISSADFPKFDRNSNLGGADGLPVCAVQTVYRACGYPSHLLLSVLGTHAL